VRYDYHGRRVDCLVAKIRLLGDPQDVVKRLQTILEAEQARDNDAVVPVKKKTSKKA
jgi:hypothetical protein